MFTYRIFRLIVIVFLFTYLIGSFWFIFVRFINTKEDEDNRMTFITYFDLDKLNITEGLCDRDTCKQLISNCTSNFELKKCVPVNITDKSAKTCDHI